MYLYLYGQYFQGDLMEMKIHADPKKANDDECSLVSSLFKLLIYWPHRENLSLGFLTKRVLNQSPQQ